MSSIAILGSLNLDFVTRMERFPRPGETVSACSFSQYTGGKGANQAVACGRLGSMVSMFGALGRDMYGPKLLQSLKESDVGTDDILFCDDAPTGMAHIWVEAGGENSIAILAGANARVSPEYVAQVLPKLKQASWLLLQLEVPLETIASLLRQLPANGPKIILDPAPAQPLDQLPLERVWLITPNEHELQTLVGLPTSTVEEIAEACRRLHATTGIGLVLCKAGDRGAYLDDGRTFRHFPGYSVPSVDSTAAGDAFNGALAVAVSEGKSLVEAIGWANAAGALCVTKAGAQQSLPWRRELEEFIRNKKI
ncbi:MAG: ribokinase [Deltaproteobacteria bacterium]|nr:ribokinase [Deltaproteobacteria bacterium]